MPIAVDAMGGDSAPQSAVEGAFRAASEDGLAILLVGDRARDEASVEDGLSVEVLAGLPGPIRTRVLRAAAVDAGAPAGEVFHQHVLAVDALVTDWHGQKWVDLPGRVRAVRRDGVLAFEGAEPVSPVDR